uniref:CHK kinase-like domain-containing protein n=1 Tax=Anopheles maculatus TaxID=74869 RepID=A0A182TA66_9DIPT
MSEATVSVPAYVQERLLIVAQKEGFSRDHLFIEYEKGSKSGDGYIGLIVRARFVSAGQPSLSVICKFPPEDPQQRERFNAMLLFERETFIYQRILPAFEEIQQQYGVTQREDTYFGNYPKRYHAYCDVERGEAVLILEDLVALHRPAMKLLDQYIPVDYEHVRVLMIALGKLNACSFALKHHRPELFEQVRQLNDVLSIVLDTEQTRPLTPRNCQLAASAFDSQKEASHHRELLELCQSMWPRTGAHIRGERAEPYAALNHGDCWTNNVMFGYDANGHVNDVCLLDWQMARYGSPALDYTLFIFLCGELELRREKFHTLVTEFYNAFSTSLLQLGVDPEKALPRVELEKQFVRFGKLALAMGTYALPNFAQLPTEICETPAKYQTDKRLQYYCTMMRELVKDSEQFDQIK